MQHTNMMRYLNSQNSDTLMTAKLVEFSHTTPTGAHFRTCDAAVPAQQLQVEPPVQCA